MEVKIKLLTKTARMPEKKSAGAVAWDLYWDAEDRVFDRQLPVGGRALLSTGVAIELPPGYEAQIRGRSSYNVAGLWVAMGTIDSDYRGAIYVSVHNVGPNCQSIKRGDRIAQLVIQKLPKVTLVQADELSETERGDKGFGSTGR